MKFMLTITNDSVIANVTHGPLTFWDILAFKMHGDTNIYGNLSGPALSTRGNLALARARGAGSPRTVKHCYLPH